MIMTDEKRKIVLGIGGIHSDKAPCSVVTCLGSCIAVCLYAPSKKVGGMVHIAMADSTRSARKDLNEGKYADTGIAALLGQLKRDHNVAKTQLVAKVFGGAKILKTVNGNIGDENKAAVDRILGREGIDVIASQTGGEKGYRIEFDLGNGAVLCQSIGEKPKEY